MPVSKRATKVTLAQTTKKTRDRKDQLITKIRDCVIEFDHLFVFRYENMRSNLLKEVRQQWPESRFFLGNNKVMQVALGRTQEEEVAENLCLVADHVEGNCGLMFTNEDTEKVQAFFRDYAEPDFARTGFIATETRVLPAGPTQFEFSQEAYLRNQLQMPTSLKKGVVVLEGNYTVCTEGQQLSAEQARLLKLLDIKMSQFRLPLQCVYSDGRFATL